MIGIPNPWPGCFIAFEGADGSGKSRQLEIVKRMIQNLQLSRHPIAPTKEPDKDGEWGARIYAELGKPNGLHLTNPLGFQAWYAEDSRKHMKKVVIPALRAGEIVLTDRCRLSMAYGIKKWNSDFHELVQMHWGVIGRYFIWPDAIFVFDVPVATALERLAQKGVALDMHERESVLERVVPNYRIISEKVPNCHLIDGNRDLDVVFDSCSRIISELLVDKFPECRGRITWKGELL